MCNCRPVLVRAWKNLSPKLCTHTSRLERHKIQTHATYGLAALLNVVQVEQERQVAIVLRVAILNAFPPEFSLSEWKLRIITNTRLTSSSSPLFHRRCGPSARGSAAPGRNELPTRNISTILLRYVQWYVQGMLSISTSVTHLQVLRVVRWDGSDVVCAPS